MNTFQRQQTQNAPASRHLYSKKQLIALTIVYIVSLIVTFVGANLATNGFSGIVGLAGILLFFSLVTYILFVDWRGFLTLNGKFSWDKVHGGERAFAIGVFIVFNAPVFGIYLVQSYRTYRRYRQQEPFRKKLETSRRESAAGIIPFTDGVCDHCHKPLQLGKDICPHCGTIVTPKARVCPVCAELTLPDARWCPNCRAQLDIAS